jgi:hypothetical protein
MLRVSGRVANALWLTHKVVCSIIHPWGLWHPSALSERTCSHVLPSSA